MPSMLFRNWYNNNTVSFSNYSTDASSFIVGQVLIRQLRVKIGMKNFFKSQKLNNLYNFFILNRFLSQYCVDYFGQELLS